MGAIVKRLEMLPVGFQLLFCMHCCAITSLQTPSCRRVFLITCLATKQPVLLPSITPTASFAR